MSLVATGRLRAAQENNVAAGRDPADHEAQGEPFGKLRALVPSDAVTAFVALIGAFAGLEVGWRIGALVAIAAATPWWVFYNYWSRADDAAKNEVRFPFFDATVGLVAFLAWSTTIPKSPWTEIDGFTTAIGLAIVAGVSLTLAVAQQARTVWLRRRRPARQRASA
jgi:hypothetical protein